MITALLLATALDAATWTPPQDAHVPMSLGFRNEHGQTVRLEDLASHPILLALGYHACHNLCGATLDGLAEGLAGLKTQDYQVVAVSIDPHETPADAAARHVRYRGRPGAASWQFLVGDPPAIQQLTRAVGFNYAPDPASHQFAHPAGIVVLAPDGRVASYLGGVAFEPTALTTALDRARRGGTLQLPEILLRCLHYDPASAGAHDGQVLTALRVGGTAIVLALGGLVLGLIRRERRRA